MKDPVENVDHEIDQLVLAELAFLRTRPVPTGLPPDHAQARAITSRRRRRASLVGVGAVATAAIGAGLIVPQLMPSEHNKAALSAVDQTTPTTTPTAPPSDSIPGPTCPHAAQFAGFGGSPKNAHPTAKAAAEAYAAFLHTYIGLPPLTLQVESRTRGLVMFLATDASGRRLAHLGAGVVGHGDTKWLVVEGSYCTG